MKGFERLNNALPFILSKGFGESNCSLSDRTLTVAQGYLIAQHIHLSNPFKGF